MKWILPADVEWILRFLEENGYETYLVGGAVRDLLRGVKPKDYDFATSATPEEILTVFKEYRSFTQGARFGTIGVLLHNHHYEITTFRKEQNYLDARRPENVDFSKEIKDDLMRRDFTINALAYHPDTGLVDFFGGEKDINQKIVRAVGNPEERFAEDRLRILRAIRFAITLGFEIENKTKQAILNLLPTITVVATERVHDEIVKCFYQFETLEETFLDVLKLYFPILKDNTKENWAVLLSLFKVLPPRESYYYTFLFLEFPNEMVISLLKQFKVSSQVLKEVKIFTKYLHTSLPNDRAQLKEYLNELGKDVFFAVLFVKRMYLWSTKGSMKELEEIYEATESIIKNKEPYLLKHIKITGKTLLENNFPQGKKMKAVLEYILDLVIQDPSLNEETILLQHAKKYLANLL